MLAQYVEVESLNTNQITALLKSVEKDKREANKNNDLVVKAKLMLKQWGIYNSYSSKCGYKNVSSMFSLIYPNHTKSYIETEIDFIETALLVLKKSSDIRKNQQYKVAELYYKGFDIVDSGSDWSERFNDSYIADYIGISERTLYRRLNSVHSHIISQESFLKICY